MKVRLLPSSAGRESQFQSLTSFIVDDRLAVDGGSLGFALPPEKIGEVRHIIVTHTHSDHIASLPIYIAEAFPALVAPIVVYGTAEVIAALRRYVFNDQVWPNFENIPLINGSAPGLQFRELMPGIKAAVDGIEITPIPVNHIVPTVGLLVEKESTAVLFTSDTYVTDEIWRAANKTKNLKAVFVDVSYPNDKGELAQASKHLTPSLLASELKKLDRNVEVYAVHIKPTNRENVITELSDLHDPRVSVAEIDRLYEW